MIENIKNTTTPLIKRYIGILEQNGDPNEKYKYSAINTFQDNWNLDAEDFYQMFLNSFSKRSNLLFKYSWDFIEKSAKFFPEEVREMFRNLYDESVEIPQRIKTFISESEELLPKVKQELNKEDSLNHNQDERTISFYLAFRYPEKYILYKYDFYKNFCKEINIKPKKAGERFLHFQELASQIIYEGLLEEKSLIYIYRKLYPKPKWSDKYLMVQNILYVIYREDLKELNLLELFKKYDRKQLEEYYSFLDEIIEKFGLQEDDEKLVFNADKNKIVFTIGQRYVWNTGTIGKDDYKFRTISEQPIGNTNINFDGSPEAFLCNINDISEAQKNKQSIFSSIEKELGRTEISGYSKFNKKDLEKMAFDVDFRNDILSQLDYNSTTENKMENMDTEIRNPLNQILFGAPGTGKTYNTKRIAVEIINGKKQRSREEINKEYEYLADAKQIVFTTFHQSLSYEDFIEGIKPETTNGNVTYEVKDGIFKNLCLNASTENTKKYILIIDEINRGNVSAIFGELITLLEEDKRKGNKEQTEVILPYSNDKFSVPNNVYVIGTMNTADRSVEVLDTALRRRFSFTEIQANPDILLDSDYTDVDLKRLLETINQRIEVLIDKDHQIGHSYFIGIKNLEDLKLTFKDKIIPLLEEYFYGDFGKIGLVLGESFIYKQNNKVKFPKNFEYENDFLEDKKVYRFTPWEKWDKSTFISVCED